MYLVVALEEINTQITNSTLNYSTSTSTKTNCQHKSDSYRWSFASQMIDPPANYEHCNNKEDPPFVIECKAETPLVIV